MVYSVLADLVLILHLAFILYVLFGGLLAVRWPRAVYFHLPAALYGVSVEVVGWVCPLTPLENYFRRLAGRPGFEESFVQHYLLPVIYPPGLTRSIQLVLGGGVVVANVAVYVYVWHAADR